MMQPTLDMFYAILRQVVIDMKYAPGVSINTFAHVDVAPRVDHASFGYSYDDYLNGYFWSRAWVGRGANPNMIKKQFPALFVETQPSTVQQPDRDSICYNVGLVFLDKIECSACPPQIIRSGPTVYNNLIKMARAVLREAHSYVLYELDDGQETYTQWVSPGRLEYLVSQGVNVLSDDLDELCKYFEPYNVEFRPWGDYPGHRGLLVNIQFNTCEPLNVAFKYDQPVEGFLADQNCAEC
ncbi:MAG: hypothetical protein AAFU03_05790 [Bacteroidota bacterium]